MAYESRTETGRPNLPPSQGIVAGGASAGIIAGIAMAMFAMFYGWAVGVGFWTPMRLIAASILGDAALVTTPWALLLGMGLHFATAAFWGIVFASLLRKNSTTGTAFWSGLFYGVGVWAVMSYIGLPILDRTMEPRVALMAGSWFVEHLIYGAVLAVTPTLKRQFAERPLIHRRAERREPVGV